MITLNKNRIGRYMKKIIRAAMLILLLCIFALQIYAGDDGACDGGYGPPLPHQASDTLSYDTQSHYYTCINCDEAIEKTREEHSFGNWYLTLSATEEREGERARECVDCGYIERESTPRVTENEGIKTGALTIALIAVAVLAVAAVVCFKLGLHAKLAKFIVSFFGR